MKQRKTILAICALLVISSTGCSLIDFKDEPENSSETVAEMLESVISAETAMAATVVETSAETSASDAGDNHIPSPLSGELITEISSQATIDCSLTSHDYVGSVCSDRIAVVRLNFNGSRPIDSELTTVENSEIIFRNLDGELLNVISIDSIYIPIVRFDFNGGLHVFLSDGNSVEHRIYTPEGVELRSNRTTLDVIPLETVFDSADYLYILTYDWENARQELRMYSPDGELIGVRNDNNASLITIDEVPYIVRQSGNANFITFVPAAEYIQDLNYERIVIRDINGINIVSGYGGFYYYDSANRYLCAYDFTSETSYILVRNASLNYDATWQIGDELITAAGYDNPIKYR